MTSLDLQQFLEKFFGDGNAIRWSKYVDSAPNDSIRVSLEPWIRRLQKQQSPFCLPRVNATSKQTTWYVLCIDSREARSIRESLQAFIGPTYAKFDGEFATFSSTDQIDQLCERHFGSLVFRLPIVEKEARPKVVTLLNAMMDFRDRDSSHSLSAIKPIGRLLRDLEMAIIAINEESANQIYTEIRSRGRLSATNLAFLQVRVFSAFDRWAEIMLMPNLNDLLNVRRPNRISEQIATAVYRQLFFKFEESSDPAAAIEAFQREGMRYQSLVRSTDGFHSADAIKFALLAAVGANTPNRNLAERLLERSLSDADQSWCKSVLAQIVADQPAEVVAEAIGAFDLAEIRYNEGSFDEAFALYIQQTPTYRSICRVLETAVEIDDSQTAWKAIEFLDSADEDVRATVLQRRVCTNQIEILTGILGQAEVGTPKLLDSLTAWFACVDSGSHAANLNQVLEYGLRGWVSSPEFNTSQAAELLRKSRMGIAAEIIRNAVPIFIREFLVDRELERENKPIYNALIDLLVYDETIGSDDLTAVEQLIEAILTTAPSHDPGNNEFHFAVDVTKHLWETVASPRYLDWALSMLDLLIDTGAQQHANLTPVMVAIIESVRPWIRRVSQDQWSLLELLASDLGLTALLEGVRPEETEEKTVGQESNRDALKGKSIAVYSITERIARRFGQLAEQAFDEIKIHYIHDKSLTDRMKSLAKTADIFIVNTWDAKHAATIGIKQSRSAEKITIEPPGKSASSLVRSLIDSLGSIS